MQQDWLLMTAPKLAFEGSLTLTPLASQPVRAGEFYTDLAGVGTPRVRDPRPRF